MSALPRGTASLLVMLGLAAGCSGHGHDGAEVPVADLTGYEVFLHRDDGRERRVFWKGQGPPVLIIQELPGMTPEMLRLGNLVASAGYRVYLPLLFGDPGEQAVFMNSLRVFFGSDFHLFSKSHSGPIVDWVRSLVAEIGERHPEQGIGIIGMCLTGGFGIPLLSEPGVRAVVLSQPSLPLPWGAKRKAALAASQAEIDAARDSGVPMLGYRFTCDTTSPPERFETLRRSFPGQFRGTEIDCKSRARFGDAAHAVLTAWFVDEPEDPTRQALDEVLDLFARTLPDRH